MTYVVTSVSHTGPRRLREMLTRQSSHLEMAIRIMHVVLLLPPKAPEESCDNPRIFLVTRSLEMSVVQTRQERMSATLGTFFED